MRILYPVNPLNPKEADDIYQAEFLAAKAAGIDCSLFDFDALAFGEFEPRPKIQTDEKILYRGWMMTPEKYSTWESQVCKKGSIPITSTTNYHRCHHLLGWYETCSAFTAESYFFDVDDNLESNIAALGWDAYFVKDYVKSNNADKGSIGRSPADVLGIIQQLEFYRGAIEGGISIRRVEDHHESTECRYFVIQGKAFSPNDEVPELVTKISHLIDAPFYSIDLIENTQGELRLVELGDGQVSSRKQWPLEKFIQVLAEFTESSSNGQTHIKREERC